MAGGFRPVLLLCAIFAGSIGHCSESIELVLDQSMEMWQPLPDGTPRIVAVRSAISAFLASPALADLGIELGLSAVGGGSDISTSWGCEDVGQILPVGGIDLATWSRALGELDPRGGRPLVRGIEEAVYRLASVDGERRIVVITAGGDDCSGDLGGAWDRMTTRHPSIELRVIGIDLERGIADSLSALTPTRNASDASTLLGFLKWATLPAAATATRPETLDLLLSQGGSPLSRGSVRMIGPTLVEEISSAIDEGRARFRLPPGLFGASIGGDGLLETEISGLVHDGSGRTVDLELSASPTVTLEVDPERPPAGGEAHVHFWGAPAGDNWMMLAIAGSALGEFLEKSPAPGPTGEVSLSLPDTPNNLEVRFATHIGNGVLQQLGSIDFDSARRRVSLEAPERTEIRTPITLRWSGENLVGDHLTIDRNGSDSAESVSCLPVGGAQEITVTSPMVPGEYVVRYVTRRGRTVARSSIEVFEILATVDGPEETSPNTEIEVSWDGPDAEHDYLSVAPIDGGADEYWSFSPSSAGNPARLTAPKDPGEYELRYVRGADGKVLARERMSVIAVAITLEVPPEVGIGTRFQVSWTGTSGPGDFITVAQKGSGPGKKLDSTYVSLGSPASLAAPFKPGRYVVRYISGESRQIVAEAPIEAR